MMMNGQMVQSHPARSLSDNSIEFIEVEEEEWA